MKTSDKPIIQKFHLKGIKHILPEDAKEAVDNKEAVFVDVREAPDIYAAHITDSLFLPMWQISEWLPRLSKDLNMIFLCNEGIKSAHVANFLATQGYKNVTNLDGGMTAWKERKLPFEAFKKP